MRKLILLIVIIFTLSGCEKANPLSILTVDNLQSIKEIESNEFSIYNLLLVDNQYQIEKYSTKGLFLKNYTFELGTENVSSTEMIFNDGVLAFIYYVEGKNKIYVKTFNEDLVLTNSLSVSYSEEINQDDNQVFITYENLYLANQNGITKYEYGDNVIKELLSYKARAGKVFNLEVKEEVYLIVGVENKAFYYDEQLVLTKSERVLVKLDNNLKYIDKQNLNDKYEIGGFEINKEVYIYGENNDNQVLVSKYNDSLELLSSASFSLNNDQEYTLSGIQVDGDKVKAIIEAENSRVGVYNLDLDKEEYKESFSKFFTFDFPDLENILGINNEYFIVSDGYYLYMIETK